MRRFLKMRCIPSAFSFGFSGLSCFMPLASITTWFPLYPVTSNGAGDKVHFQLARFGGVAQRDRQLFFQIALCQQWSRNCGEHCECCEGAKMRGIFILL